MPHEARLDGLGGSVSTLRTTRHARGRLGTPVDAPGRVMAVMGGALSRPDQDWTGQTANGGRAQPKTPRPTLHRTSQGRIGNGSGTHRGAGPARTARHGDNPG